MKLTLVEKIQNEPNTDSFFFKPDENLEFKPGQFLHYQIPNPNSDDRGTNRFFSIASAPFENIIRLTTKFTPSTGSTFKKDLQKLQTGESIEASGPKGSFTTDVFISEGKKLCFIAGGIGITPFRSILLDLDHRGKPLNISLLYANKSKDALFKEELEQLAKKHPEFKIFYIVSDESVSEEKINDNIEVVPGKVDADLIRKLVPSFQKPIYYISGPESMVETLEEVVWNMGIPKERTKRDYYPGYEHY